MTLTEQLLRDALEAVLNEGLPVGPGYTEVEATARKALAATSSTEVVGELTQEQIDQERESYWDFEDLDSGTPQDYGTDCPVTMALCKKAAWNAWKARAALAQRPPEGNAKVGSVDIAEEIRTYIDAHSGKVGAEAAARTTCPNGKQKCADCNCWMCAEERTPHPVAQVVAAGLTDDPVLYVRQEDLIGTDGTIIASQNSDEKWAVPLFLKAQPASQVVAGGLTELLNDCKEKLAIYREKCGSEYVGGVEFMALMKRIDAATLKGEPQ